MRYLFFVILIGISMGGNAQNSIIDDLRKVGPSQAVITVHQDSAITALIGRGRPLNNDVNPNKGLKARGFRVQVYAGNNSREARNQATAVAKQVEIEFPEFPVYAYFRPPRWLCRVGDFRTIEEADAAMRQLKATGHYKEVSIVREQINISLE